MGTKQAVKRALRRHEEQKAMPPIVQPWTDPTHDVMADLRNFARLR